MIQIIALVSAALMLACGPAPVRPRAEHPDTVTTMNGEVLGVDETSPERALAQNVRITVRAGSRPVRVELGPGWFLDEHGLRFEREQRVEVSGVHDPERDVFVARRVRRGDSTLELRDAQGRPLWPPSQSTPVSPPAQEAR